MLCGMIVNVIVHLEERMKYAWRTKIKKNKKHSENADTSMSVTFDLEL